MRLLAEQCHQYIKSPSAKKELCRVIKFCLVGLSGVGVSVGSLWLFTEVLGLFYVISAIISHVLSVTNNFVWNQTWTFRDRSGATQFSVIVSRWLKFLCSTALAAGVFLGILTLLTEVFGLYYIFSALCAIAVATPVNFLASTLWVWKIPPARSQSRITKGR